jgi:hypothetical protein
VRVNILVHTQVSNYVNKTTNRGASKKTRSSAR